MRAGFSMRVPAGSAVGAGAGRRVARCTSSATADAAVRNTGASVAPTGTVVRVSVAINAAIRRFIVLPLYQAPFQPPELT
jgi:hypothetical protein